jgi:hypothetical protein
MQSHFVKADIIAIVLQVLAAIATCWPPLGPGIAAIQESRMQTVSHVHYCAELLPLQLERMDSPSLPGVAPRPEMSIGYHSKQQVSPGCNTRAPFDETPNGRYTRCASSEVTGPLAPSGYPCQQLHAAPSVFLDMLLPPKSISHWPTSRLVSPTEAVTTACLINIHSR